MDYNDIVRLALKGRSVNQAAKDWEMAQVTLNRYVKGDRLPDYETALRMAQEAGIEPGKMFEVLAQEQRRRRSPVAAAIATATLATVTLFLTGAPEPAQAKAPQGSFNTEYRLCKLRRLRRAVRTMAKRLLPGRTLQPATA